MISLQRQLAEDVALALPVANAPSAPQVGGTTHPGARDAYLRGRQARERMTAEKLRDAIRWARRATGLDPCFAGAHAQLGLAIVSLPFLEERSITAAERE
jgi:hypothetical protein